MLYTSSWNLKPNIDKMKVILYNLYRINLRENYSSPWKYLTELFVHKLDLGTQSPLTSTYTLIE